MLLLGCQVGCDHLHIDVRPQLNAQRWHGERGGVIDILAVEERDAVATNSCIQSGSMHDCRL